MAEAPTSSPLEMPRPHDWMLNATHSLLLSQVQNSDEEATGKERVSERPISFAEALTANKKNQSVMCRLMEVNGYISVTSCG